MRNKFQQDLIDDTWKLVDTMFPTQATISGIHSFDSKLESFDVPARTMMRSSLEKAARELARFPLSSLTLSEKIDLILTFIKICELRKLLTRRSAWESDPLFYLIPYANAIYYMTERPYASLGERAECILERLCLYPSLLEEARYNLRPINHPHISNAIPVSYGVRKYLEETVERLSHKLPALADRFGRAGEKALGALVEYREFLMQKLLPQAPRTLISNNVPLFQRIGEEFLVFEEPDELWQIAQNELEGAERSLHRHSVEMSGKTDWRAVIDERRRSHPSIETLVNAYRDSLRRARKFTGEEIMGPEESKDVRITDTPLFLRIRLPTVGYSASGGLEAEQETFFFLTPIVTGYSEESEMEQLREHCYGRIQFIPLHEAYPGHHLQFCCAALNPSYVVRRTRSIVAAEGWAVHCEDLARESGYLSDDGILFSLEASIWRAARMWIEVGIHSGKIDFEAASCMLKVKLGASDEVAAAEIMRSVISPGDASGYCLGGNEIRKLARLFQEKLPGADSKEFYTKVLRAGCIPPALIGYAMGLKPEEELDRLWERLRRSSSEGEMTGYQKCV